MSIHSFNFYHVVKNEDANPYVHSNSEKKNGFIVVADGLGGSGSTVHKFSEYAYENLHTTLHKKVLSEYYAPGGEFDRERLGDGKDPKFDEWLKGIFKPMIDDSPDTSALWGSRIAISRFVYYMLTNPDLDLASEDNRQKIVDFLYKGLEDTRRGLNLKAGDISGQSILPTTLVSIRYQVEEDGKVFAEVIWAGDSRAYALIPGEGMKQLSVDDEDESGAICNLFAINREGKKFDTKLHYRTFRLPEQCAIYVCSDGVFDPFSPIDNIGVEAQFLEALSKSDSFPSLNDHWHGLYRPMRHDDTSVAFVAFGYEKFEQFKNDFIGRHDAILTAFNDYHTFKKAYPIIVGEEEHPREYITERAARRQEQIARILADNIVAPGAERDVTVTDTMLDLHERLKADAVKCVSDEIIAFLDDGPEKAAETFLVPDDNQQSPITDEIRKFLDYAQKVQVEVTRPGILQDKIRAAVNEGERLAGEVTKRIKQLEYLSTLAINGRANIADMATSLEFCYEEGTMAESLKKNLERINNFYTSRENSCTNVRASMFTLLTCWEKKSDMSNMVDKKITLICKTVASEETKPADCDQPAEEAEKKLVLKFYPADQHFFRDMKSTINWYNTLNEELNSLDTDKSVADYTECVAGMKGLILQTLQDPAAYYTDLLLNFIRPGLEIDATEMFQALVELFNDNESLFDECIQAFLQSKEPTIIDGIFNASKLNLLREFNSFDPEKVLENRRIVDDMLAAYETLDAYLA